MLFRFSPRKELTPVQYGLKHMLSLDSHHSPFTEQTNTSLQMTVIDFDLKIRPRENMPVFNTEYTSQNWVNYFEDELRFPQRSLSKRVMGRM
jgi:hypothetical protein